MPRAHEKIVKKGNCAQFKRPDSDVSGRRSFVHICQMTVGSLYVAVGALHPAAQAKIVIDYIGHIVGGDGHG